MLMTDFRIAYIKANGFQGTAIEDMVLVGADCQFVPNNNATGIHVDGGQIAGFHVRILQSHISCMGAQGILLEDTRSIQIGSPDTSGGAGDANTITENTVGIRIENSCRIDEYYNQITDNVEQGMHITLSPTCDRSNFLDSVVKDNGAEGILVTSASPAAAYVKIIPAEIVNNGGRPIVMNNVNKVTTPEIIGYNAANNTVQVAISAAPSGVTARYFEAYIVSSDPAAAGGGGVYQDVFLNAIGATTVNLNLNSVPGATASTVSVMVRERYSSLSNMRTSEMSNLYDGSGSPTAVRLAEQASVSTTQLLPILLMLIGGITVGIAWRRR